MSGGFGFNVKQNPDADLIRLCDEIADLNQRVETLMEGEDAAPVEANYAHWEELSTRAALIPAETVAGLRARLRAIGPGILTDMPRLASEPGSLRAQLVSAADDLCRFAVGHMPGDEALRVSGANSEAELIAACEALRLSESKSLRLYYGSRAVEDDWELDRLDGLAHEEHAVEQPPLLEVIGRIPAKTLAGLQAKARAYAMFNPKLTHLTDQGTFGDVILSIVRDLVGDYDAIAELETLA